MKTSDAIVALAKRGIGPKTLVNALLRSPNVETAIVAGTIKNTMDRPTKKKLQKACDDAYTALTSFDGITAVEHRRIVKQLKELLAI